MLIELKVEDLGVIDTAEVSFERGCVALTGETGAGKTLLVAALGLLLGERSDRGTVRAGAAEARVEGRYVVAASHPAIALLREQGIVAVDAEGEDVELVVSRTVSADGRGGRARVNGRLVTASLLSEAGRMITEVAGQHEHQRIGSAAWQRGHLDEWAGEKTVELAHGVRDAVREAAEWSRRLEELARSERERRRSLDVLTYEISEIEAAALRPGESRELAREAARLERAEATAEGIGSAVAAIADEGGAQDLLSSAAAQIVALAGDDDALRDLGARLESAAVESSDVAEELARASVAFDPDALEQIHQRLALVAHLQRKYGADEDEVLAYLEGARSKAAQLAAVEEGIEDSERRAADARARAEELAAGLTAARREAGPRLEKEVVRRLESLGLAGATFEVVLAPAELGEGGAESVEYLVGFNPGEAPRSIRKVASGGELSRLALALNLAGTHGDAATLVFDEVDAGVGGEAARSVGAALAELAESTGRQVMVVTHLPQVAAFADAQYRIEKLLVDGRAAATVTRVEGPERIAELSRMLAGLPDSDRARGHAEELLEHAERRRLERSAARS